MRSIMLPVLCIIASLAVFVSPCGAGWGRLTGGEPQIWTAPERDEGAIPRAHYSVIIARVRDVAEVKDDRALGTHQATLEPMVALAGHCDPGAETILHVRFYCGGGDTSIFAVPPKGAMVLAVMRNQDYIASEECMFMPERSALIEIHGLNDPRVLDTIIRLRKARHPDDAGLTGPTTAPADGKDGNRR